MYSYMIVDDEPLIRRGIRKKLECVSHKISCCGEAGNGVMALEKVEQLHPDVIITDMKMPLMDGQELLPILAERYPDIYIIVISGYRDFEYTQGAIRAKAIDYQLKPIKEEELAASVLRAIEMKEKQTAYLRELIDSKAEKEQQIYENDIKALTNMLLGYAAPEKTLFSERLKDLQKNHQLAVLTVHGNRAFEKEKMEKVFQDWNLKQQIVYLQHENIENLGFYVIFLPDEIRLSAKKLLADCADKILESVMACGTAGAVGISSLYESMAAIHAAFEDTVKALDGKRIQETNQYYFINKESDRKTLKWDQEQKLLFHVETGMVSDVRTDTEDLFECIKEQNITLGEAKQFCRILFEKIRFLAAAALEYVKPEGRLKNRYRSEDVIFSVEELRDYYGQFFTNVAVAFGEKHIYTTDDVAENMKIYIDRNYASDLTVEFLASVFHLNRNYCSTLFRKKTGSTIVNYVNETRIAHAKEMLAYGDKKIQQISVAVGYENIKYFFRIFKKYEKISPEQYRKQRNTGEHSHREENN